ncbi:unnamed protein product [Paramecium sonneborni]|uniref:Protein kinase domain-containing protein n=1 Tax=Paramecium sonneborni TaxID=65129 RepID=A0A8S1RKH7_9CILI|nr:unnamed protein product [Paramecium sonneborni]
MSNVKLQQNWEKLQKLCQSGQRPSQKRSTSKDQRSIPNLQSSRQLQRRASQQDLVYKVVECSTQDIENKNSKQQLDQLFNGLNGLLGYELIMKKGKLDELLKKLKYFLYCDILDLKSLCSKLGDYIINPKLYNIIVAPNEEQPSKEICDLLIQELQLQISKRKQIEWNYQALKESRKQEKQEQQDEITGLKQAIALLEQQNQTIQYKIRNDNLYQQYEELKRFNKSLSNKNDDLYFQNLSLLEKLQSVYKQVDVFQTEQLLFPYLFQKEKYDDALQQIKKIVDDIINLDIQKPQQFIDVDYKEKVINMTPRPNYEHLISKYNTKSIKYIRQLQSTNDIIQYLIQQLYQQIIESLNRIIKFLKNMKPRSRGQNDNGMPIRPIQDIYIGNYVVEKKKLIGRGQYGIVYQCYDQRNKELLLCAKCVDKKGVESILLKREIQILNLLKPLQRENENLVELVEIIEDSKDQNLYIIMEKCNQGDLKCQMDAKQKKQTWFTVNEAVEIIKQVVKGYEALFKNKVIHRDLKPANILISNDIYKIADLGMGRILDDMVNLQLITKVGTPAYAAPQLFLEPKFSSKADVYSLGVIFYQLIYNDLPINANSQAQLIENLRNLQTNPIQCPNDSALRENVPLNIRTLIEQMLQFEESDRTSWMQLFSCPIFSLNISQPKRSNPKKNTLINQNLSFYQEFYRVETKPGQSKNDKILHLIQILITKSDLAAKTYKLLQDSKFEKTQNQIKFDNDQTAAFLVCLSGYRYKTILNAFGLLINQPSSILPEFKNRFSQIDLQEFSQLQTETNKFLKEYINKILNLTILQFREDECVFLRNSKRQDNQEFKSLKTILNDEDNTDFTIFSKLFRKIYMGAIQYINWNKKDPKNKELITYFDKMGDMDLQFDIDKLYNIKPCEILIKSQKILN